MKANPRPIRFEAWMIVKDGRKLRRARLNAKLTQADLARLTRVTQQYISAIERGVDNDCSDRVAERMCQYLGVDVEEHFTERQRVLSTPAVTTRTRPARSAA